MKGGLALILGTGLSTLVRIIIYSRYGTLT